jgi:hypothetical protein
MAIHLLHGCAPTWSPGQQSVRNYVAEAALRSYLKALPSKYGGALSSNGPDVLTIDDSTKGGGRAAAIACEYGHVVFLFVNPHQIETGEPYYFTLLNTCLDNWRETRVLYRGKQYEFPTGARAFRLAAKRVLSCMEPEAALKHVAEIGGLLNCSTYEIPEHAQTLTLGELLHLRDIGVTIENHGWAHRNIDALSENQLKDDVSATQQWLLDRLDVRSTRYAIPFGETKLPIGSIEEVSKTVFLADMRLAPGKIGNNTWNRIEITGGLQNAQ